MTNTDKTKSSLFSIANILSNNCENVKDDRPSASPSVLESKSVITFTDSRSLNSTCIKNHRFENPYFHRYSPYFSKSSLHLNRIEGRRRERLAVSSSSEGDLPTDLSTPSETKHRKNKEDSKETAHDRLTDDNDSDSDNTCDNEINISSTDEQNGDNATKPKKKTRTVFSRHQIFYLESAFDTKRYLSSTERAEIATALNLTETQVKVWFQNRRNKWKSQLTSPEQGVPNERYPGLLFGTHYPLSLAAAPPPLHMYGRPMFYF